MDLIDRIKTFTKALTGRAGVSNYLDATILKVERTPRTPRQATVAAMIARDIGYIGICAAFNARNVAASDIRLYRPADKASKGRRVRGAEKSWLLSRKAGYGPGYRTAIKAQNLIGQSGELEELDDHPLLDFIHDPNPDMQGFAYWEQHHGFLEVAGNAYHNVIRDGGRWWLYPLYPQHVIVKPGTDTLVAGYRYGRASENARDFAADEVLHAMFAPAKHTPLYGVSWTQSIWPEHDLRQAMNQAATALFDNGARPDFLLSFKNPIPEPERERIKAAVREQFGGVQNNGNFLITSDADVKILNMALKDLEYIEGRKKVESDIAAAAGVPEALLRMNDANLASATAADPTYARYTLLPRIIKHVEWLNERVAPLYGDNVFFAAMNPVPDDETARADQSRQDVLAGVMTINEARRLRGLEDSDHELADQPLVNGQPLGYSPLSMLTPPPTEPPPDDGQSPDPEPEPDNETKAKPAAASEARLQRTGSVAPRTEAITAATAKAGAAPVSQRSSWLGGSGCACGRCSKNLDRDTLTQDPDPSFTAATNAAFAAQRNGILAEMEAKPSGYKSRPRAVKDDRAQTEAERLLKLWGVTDPKWVKVFYEAAKNPTDQRLVAAAGAAFRFVASVAPGSIDQGTAFSLNNAEAAKFVQRHTAALLDGLESVNATTADMIARQLREGISQGENIAKLSARVREAFDGMTESGEPMSLYRSKMIARTETARAQTSGNLAGWAATEVVEGKRWLLSPNACEFCEAAAKAWEGRTASLDEPFFARGSTLRGTDGGVMSLDFADTEAAPLHPHCKCDTVPVIKGVGPIKPPPGGLA